MAEAVPTIVSIPAGKTSRFPWGATVLLGVSLVLLLVFAVRVFSFYRQIQKGEIDTEAFALSQPSTEDALAALVASAKGSGQIATSDDPKIGGNAGAFLTIVEFADFGCPYSKQESGIVRALAKTFSDSVVFQYRDFPIEELREGAELGAYAGECAHEQGKFWQMHDKLFAIDGITQESVLAAAEDLDLDIDNFVACVNSDATALETETDLADGVAAGVRGTPTFFFNGEKVEGAIPFELFVSIIEAFLAKS